MENDGKFILVLNAIKNWCEKDPPYPLGIYQVQLKTIEELKIFRESGELYYLINLLVENGYMISKTMGRNPSEQKSYRITIKGINLINK
jgi:DNA-binding PadR family transcriptional regulator